MASQTTRTLLADVLLRAVAALETPGDLTDEERRHVIEDARQALDQHEADIDAAPELPPALLDLYSAAEPVYRRAGFSFAPMERALRQAEPVLARVFPDFRTAAQEAAG